MDWKLFRIKLYEWSCVLRVPALLTALLALGVSGWLVWETIVGNQAREWIEVTSGPFTWQANSLLLGGLFLLGLLGGTLTARWLLFLGWFFPSFRLVRWWCTRYFFQAVRWVSRPGLALSALALALLVFIGYEMFQTVRHSSVSAGTESSQPQSSERTGDRGKGKENPESPRSQKPEENSYPVWLSLLVMAGLMTIVRGMSRARRRIIVEPFQSYLLPNSGSDESRSHGRALASLLRSEIAGITALYQVIDEIHPEQPKVEAVVSVENIGDFLKEAISPASNVKAFGVEIPLGSLFTMFSWLVRGPRLTGSLHLQKEKEGDVGKRVLLAELGGGGLSGSWRVHEGDLLSADRDIDADPISDGSINSIEARLVRQLAFRIVTILMRVGSPRWQAVWYYTEGLRCYRDAQRTERDKLLNLCRAERFFIRALGFDQRFSQCHYNLGVINHELGKDAAAEAAFRRAAEEEPASFDAAYGLAQRASDRPSFKSTIHYCNAALRISPQDARAWNLKAWAMLRAREEGEQPFQSGIFSDCLRRLIQPKRGPWERKSGKPWRPLPAPGWRDIRVICEVAAALAWESLCKTLWRTSALEQATWIAAACTVNSGIPYCLMGKRWRASRRFWQAVNLSEKSPELRLEMGDLSMPSWRLEGGICDSEDHKLLPAWRGGFVESSDL